MRDFAAGNGNASLAAARRSCDVTSTDYLPALLERARERAAADRFAITFREADANELPFEDGAFDVVLSPLGVMFTPNRERAAKELIRVCRRDGKIGLANWTPDGFLGRVFKTIGKYVAPPAAARSPALWCSKARLDEIFDPRTATLEVHERISNFRYLSAQHWLESFETCRRRDLFYRPPGHSVRVVSDAATILFSPLHEHQHVMEHMQDAMRQ